MPDKKNDMLNKTHFDWFKKLLLDRVNSLSTSFVPKKLALFSKKEIWLNDLLKTKTKCDKSQELNY